VKVGGRVLDLSPPPDVDLSEAREILVVLDRVILAPDQRQEFLGHSFPVSQPASLTIILSL
jgi:hypothetical protein